MNVQQPYPPTFTPNLYNIPYQNLKAPTPSSALTWQWIQGGEETARNWYISPNTTIALWDSEEQVIYLKSSDNTGRPTLKILDYTIREERPTDGANYATRADVDNLTKAIEDLKNELNSLTISKKEKEETK